MSLGSRTGQMGFTDSWCGLCMQGEKGFKAKENHRTLTASPCQLPGHGILTNDTRSWREGVAKSPSGSQPCATPDQGDLMPLSC